MSRDPLSYFVLLLEVEAHNLLTTEDIRKISTWIALNPVSCVYQPKRKKALFGQNMEIRRNRVREYVRHGQSALDKMNDLLLIPGHCADPPTAIFLGARP